MNFRHSISKLALIGLLGATPALVIPALAIEVAPETLDCEKPLASQAPIGPETAEERTARLNMEFERSLQYFDRCIAKISDDNYANAASGGSGASGASGGGSAGGSDGGSAGESGSGSSGAQASSQGESGEAGESGTGARAAADSEAAGAGGQGGGAPQHGQSPSSQTSMKGGGAGAVPGDIPSGDDDDIVAQQLRQAAMETTDPVAREKLWDDYRKYKGID